MKLISDLKTHISSSIIVQDLKWLIKQPRMLVSNMAAEDIECSESCIQTLFIKRHNGLELVTPVARVMLLNIYILFF